MEVETLTPILVHPILTTDQAQLTHQALIAFLNSPEGSFSEHEAEEQRVRAELSELVFFFSNLVDHPEAFPLRSERETMRMIRGVKAAKGPAQPKSSRNKRKARQARRQSGHKARRKENRETAPDYNEAVAKVNAEQVEAEEAYQTALNKMKDRFESLAAKDSLTAEELQEVLELFGAPEAAVRARELRAENSPEARIQAAAASAHAEA